MKTKAYLTIYLALSLTAFLSVVMVLLAGIQKNTARMEEELALDTAGWSALAEYHQELLKQYDLFFIDTSYGSSYPCVDAAGEHVKNYVERNLENTNLMSVGLTMLGIQEAQAAADNGGQVLKQQIVEYEENYFGIEALEKLLSEYGAAERIDEKPMIKLRDENEEKLAAQPAPVKKETVKRYYLDTGKTETYEKEEEVPIENPADHVNALRKKGILNLVIEDTSKISGKAVSLEEYLSYRSDILQGTGLLEEKTEGNSIFEKAEERVLLDAYVFQKFGCFGQEKEGAGLDYQAEYLLEGKGTDIENLKAVVNKLLTFREAANAVYLYGDSAKRAEISAMASSIAAVALAPYLQPMLEISILFAWAYIESVQDVKALLAGGKVPVLKTASEWRTDLNSILDFNGDEVRGDTSRGLDYKQYLSAFLLMKDEEELLYSMMDVMEMDIRKTPCNENFRMDGCISGFRVAAEFEENTGGTCSFLRTYCY